MEDNVHSLYCPAHSLEIAHISLNKLNLGREIAWKTWSMDLRCQIIEDHNLMALAEQSISNVRAYKAGATGD
jgi:hypothetical protein